MIGHTELAKFEISIPFGCIAADSYSELKLLIENEERFWSQFSFKNSGSQFNDDGFKRIAIEFETALQHLTQFWATPLHKLREMDGREFAKEFDDFKKTVRRDGLIPPWSGSHMAQIALSEQQEGRAENSMLLLIGFIRHAVPQGRQIKSHLAQEGAFFCAAHGMYAAAVGLSKPSLSPDSDGASAHAISVAQDSLREIAETIENLRLRERELAYEMASMAKELEEGNKAVIEKYGRGLIDQKNKSIDQEKQRQETFKNLVDAFNAHLRISRPAELWGDLEERHTQASRLAWRLFLAGGVAFAIASLTIVFGFGESIAQAFTPTSCQTGNEASCNQISPKGPLIISAILAVSTVWLWFLRLQMKVHLSERHLFLDARERKAFAETYLALVKGGEVTTDHEAVILQSLFRPTQDGIIKDDGGIDVGIAGLLSRALNKQWSTPLMVTCNLDDLANAQSAIGQRPTLPPGRALLAHPRLGRWWQTGTPRVSQTISKPVWPWAPPVRP